MEALPNSLQWLHNDDATKLAGALQQGLLHAHTFRKGWYEALYYVDFVVLGPPQAQMGFDVAELQSRHIIGVYGILRAKTDE